MQQINNKHLINNNNLLSIKLLLENLNNIKNKTKQQQFKQLY